MFWYSQQKIFEHQEDPLDKNDTVWFVKMMYLSYLHLVYFFLFVQPLNSLNSVQTLKKKSGVNLTAMQEYEMETGGLSKWPHWHTFYNQ